MALNADFSLRASQHGAALPWQASPMPGVERRMLERLGGEVARATTIVRYAPNSHFSPHIPAGGEEFLVLEGVFQDEHGDYPVGTYVRNPPTSRHTPGSEPGCIILVKLWQFDPDDRTPVRLETHDMSSQPASGRLGVSEIILFEDRHEQVRLETWAPDASISLDADGGCEVFVLEGGFTEAGEDFGPWGWLRLPVGAPLEAKAGPDGTRVWIKTGHLPHAKAPHAKSQREADGERHQT